MGYRQSHHHVHDTQPSEEQQNSRTNYRLFESSLVGLGKGEEQMKNYFKTIWENPGAARKFIVALVGAVIVIASHGLLGGAVEGWILTITPLLTALGVYAANNERDAQ